jgi:hypothetical protein
VIHDGQWHDVKLSLNETKTLHGLRLDPCGGPGEVYLEGLVLKTADGVVLARWP